VPCGLPLQLCHCSSARVRPNALLPTTKNSMAMMYAIAALGLLQTAMAQWVGPEATHEVHYKESSGHTRFPAVGMTADEKAGLTGGFAVTGFLMVVLFILVTKAYGMALAAQTELAAIKLASEFNTVKEETV
jgi:hypothetical protein